MSTRLKAYGSCYQLRVRPYALDCQSMRLLTMRRARGLCVRLHEDSSDVRHGLGVLIRLVTRLWGYSI